MRTEKIAFAFAMALAIGTVAFAGLGMDPSAGVSDDVASRLEGGTCGFWQSANCGTASASATTPVTFLATSTCTGLSGFNATGSTNQGFTTTATACGGSCGTIAQDWHAGCGSS